MSNTARQETPTRPAKKLKIPIIIAVSLVGLLMVLGSAYLIIRQSSLNTYHNVLTDLNDSQSAQLSVYARESDEANNLKKAYQQIVFGDERVTTQSNKEALIEVRRIASQLFDRALEDCEAYKENYLHSSQIPEADDLLFLASDKKQVLKDLKELTAQTEDDSCAKVKGVIGKLTLDIDASEIVNTWNQIVDSDYTDTAAINSLKKYYDESYEIPYRKQVKSTYPKEVLEYADLVIDFGATFYDYAREEDESKFDAKYDIFDEARSKVGSYSYFEAMLARDRKESKESHQRNIKLYDLIVRANNQTSADTKFSVDIYSAALVVSALNNYHADYEYSYPEGNNLNRAIETLKEKRYLEQDEKLVLDSISYSVSKDEERTLTVKNSVEGKTYSIILP